MHYGLLSLLLGFSIAVLTFLVTLGILWLDVELEVIFPDSVISVSKKLNVYSLTAIFVLTVCSMIVILVALTGGGINAL